MLSEFYNINNFIIYQRNLQAKQVSSSFLHAQDMYNETSVDSYG